MRAALMDGGEKLMLWLGCLILPVGVIWSGIWMPPIENTTGPTDGMEAAGPLLLAVGVLLIVAAVSSKVARWKRGRR